VQTEKNGILFHGGNPYHQSGGIVDISKAWAYRVGWFFAEKHYSAIHFLPLFYYLDKIRNHENGHMPCGVL
jgi:hypothetical protein